MSKIKTNVLKSEINLIKSKYLKILDLFFQYPSKSYHVNAIIKKTGISSRLVVESLKDLEKLGILGSDKIANSKQYKLQNEKFKVKELKKFFFINNFKFKYAIDELLKIPQIVNIIVYGSVAKGEYDQESDLDLCFIGINIPEIDIKKYEKLLGRKIQIVKFSISQINKLKEKDLAFYIELLRGISYERSI